MKFRGKRTGVVNLNPAIWKQEPKGVITYTPKSDMTIHLGVVAARVWGSQGRGTADFLTV